MSRFRSASTKGDVGSSSRSGTAKTNGDERGKHAATSSPPASSRKTQGPLRGGGPAVSLGAESLVGAKPSIQAKLIVNDPGDKYEREAERVADTVMRMSDATDTEGAPRHRLEDGSEQRVIFRRATAGSAANAATRQEMDEISVPSGRKAQSTSSQEPSSSSPEQSSPDRPMGAAERQISAMEPSAGQQDPLPDMYTIQAASRYHNGCNGLFGDVRGDCDEGHTGVDYYAPVGTPTYAVTNGRVDQRAIGGYGNSIILQESGGDKSYFYAHLSGYNVENGADVEEGDQIGQTGASGNASSNRPHLHFEVRPSGKWGSAEDPLNHGFPTPTWERVYDDNDGWHTEKFTIDDCDCYGG